MATETPSENGGGPGELSPGKRKRLQQIFEHASRLMAQEQYDHDYVAMLFGQCVAGDPSNLIYLQNFLGNLQKKYNNNKKGSKLARFKGSGARSAVKKATAGKDWPAVIKGGLEMLKLNPWDVFTLTAMANACHEMNCDECELAYLKIALESNSKDPDINRSCAKALARQGHFDQAIACWHRVEEARPNDEEASHEIANLAVEKTIHQGQYDDAATGGKQRLAKKGAQAQQQRELTPEEKLERAIQRDPKEVSNYLELAELHLTSDRFGDAEDILRRAYEVSDGDEEIRERWEDAQLRNLRQKWTKADLKGREGDEAAAEEAKKLRSQLIAKELEAYKYRVERYPNNLTFKYELGVRYMFAKQYKEAIEQFQTARNDPRRKGVCMLNLGKCFQAIKQYKLATTHYESAVQDIPDRDARNKKDALYVAGKLAIKLGDKKAAEKYLSALAALDFSYKDVGDLLDRLDEGDESGDDD